MKKDTLAWQLRLDKVMRLYEENFDRMINSEIGSLKHRKYCKIEKKLDMEERRLRLLLGIEIITRCKNPCIYESCVECQVKYCRLKRVNLRRWRGLFTRKHLGI